MSGEGHEEHRAIIDVRENYDAQARRNQNEAERQMLDKTFKIKAFNNWIKSVLISKYSGMQCAVLEKALDIRRGKGEKILHVLDIGCGRGQDIKKFQLARVKYMVATDFAEECLKEYEERWSRQQQPYKLYTVAADFTKMELYEKVKHSYYDLVSAQFCLHYMFKNRMNVEIGVSSMLSNLLIGGYFIATIPDSYTILKKVKELGSRQSDGSYVYTNQFFSVKFNSLEFKEPYGNEYGFYLHNAVGCKNEETGEITYTNEWLVSLDHLEKLLKSQGVEIVETDNFLRFYDLHKEKYKQLFPKLKLNFEPGESMSKDLWEIAHLYRVLVCQKIDKGRTLNEFGIKQRIESTRGKECKRPKQQDNRRGHHSQGHYHNRDNSHRHRDHYEQRDQYHQRGQYHPRGEYHQRDHSRGQHRDHRRDYSRDNQRENPREYERSSRGDRGSQGHSERDNQF